MTLGHLDMAMGACDDLMLRDHVKRCVAALLRLGGCRRVSGSPATLIDIDQSQDDIAGFASWRPMRCGTCGATEHRR